MSASSKKKLRKEQQALQMTEKQQQAQKEAKKLKIYTITFVLVMAIVAVAFAGTMVYKYLDNSGFIARHDTVLEVNDHDISAIELNYFYIDAISSQYNTWYSQYGSYAAYIMQLSGLDISKPLNQSYYDTDKAVTWAEMFANRAINDATEIYTLYDAAKAAGHKLTDQESKNIDAILESIEVAAIEDYGYSSLKDYLVAMYGKGANKQTYRSYLSVSALANSYLSAYSDSLPYGAADYQAHLSENPNEYSTFSYTTYLLSASAFYEGGTKDEETGTVTYSDAEKAAGLAACKEAADSILAAKPTNAEELNAAIANLSIYKKDETATSEETSEETTEDTIPESSVNEDVSYAYLSDYYKDWIADSSRKAGDFTILPATTTTQAEDGTETTTTTGYYAVIFDGRNDYETETVSVRHILIGFEGGTTTGTGQTVYTEAEKLDAKQKAEEVLALFNATGKTEDDFASLVGEYSTDGGSNSNGGLYEHILPGEMVEQFNDWIFAEGRSTGDCEIVETTYGYHLIYFVGVDELNYRDYMIDTELRNEAVTTWLEGMVKNTKVGEKDISKLDLDFVISPSVSY